MADATRSDVPLPSTERLLLGPGPSPVSPAVMTALVAAPRSHLDPEVVVLLDDIRTRLARVFRAPEGSLALAVSGTGTSAMEAAVANLTEPGRRALVVINGYFGERLATMLARYGAEVARVEGEWGRAIDPGAVAAALGTSSFDLVAIVHLETSTGVVNPVPAVAALAREHGALTIVDAVTSLGTMPVDVAGWGADAVYSCSQKGLSAPSGLSPIVFAPTALARRVTCRSFYLDLGLVEDYWVRRRYHHTISAPLVYALHAALGEIESEGLEKRWKRHEQVHQRLVDALGARRLSLVPPAGERAWSLNAVRIPDGVDDVAVRVALLKRHHIEIGAGLGPLAGAIWRIGLMGYGSTTDNVDRVVEALDDAIGEEKKA